jgi:hypothetical protein
VQHGQTCGPKQPPRDTKKLRNDDAERQELYEDLKKLADERLRRGQSADDIRAIMDPDGEIEPVEREEVPRQSYLALPSEFPATSSSFNFGGHAASTNSSQMTPYSNVFVQPIQPTPMAAPQTIYSCQSNPMNYNHIYNNNHNSFASGGQTDAVYKYSGPSATNMHNSPYDYGIAEIPNNGMSMTGYPATVPGDNVSEQATMQSWAQLPTETSYFNTSLIDNNFSNAFDESNNFWSD